MTEFMILAAAMGSAGPPQAATAKKAEREPSGESPFAAALEKARKKEPDEAEMALAAQTMPAAQLAVPPTAQPAPSEQLSNAAEAPEQAAGEKSSAEPVQGILGAGSEPAKGCGSSRLETAASGSATPGVAGGQSASKASSQPAAAASVQPADAAQTAAGSQPNTAASQAGLEGQAAAPLLNSVQAEASGEAQTAAGQLSGAAQGVAVESPEPAQEAAAGTLSA